MAASLILPFQLDFEKKDLRVTSYKVTTTTTNPVANTSTTETKKRDVPIIPAGATHHTILYCINEFYNAKTALKWTSGAKLFENFNDIFEDPQDIAFWEISVATETSTSVATFNTLVKSFISYKFSNETTAYRTHKRFLSNIKKTRSLTVHQFVTLVKYHNSNILPWLPGAPTTDASHSDDDIKDIVFNSMPVEWADDFDLKHDIATADLNKIITFMEKKNTKSNRSTPNSKQNKNKNDNNERNSGNKNKSNNRNKQNSNNKNKKAPQANNRKIQPDDPCPLPGHQGHKWGQCYQNANNPNRKSNNDNNTRDNHANEKRSKKASKASSKRRNSNASVSSSDSDDGDNYYCRFVPDNNDDGNGLYTDLFHVDCCVDEQYFEEDLQRFPVNTTDALQVEERFENNENPKFDSTDHFESDTQTVSSPTEYHNSPAPPTNASGFVRLTKPDHNVDLAPTTVVVCNQINDDKKRRIYFKTLLDSGTTDNIVTRTALPTGTELLSLENPITMQTANGSYSCKHYCYLRNAMFPELSLTRRCKAIKCLVIDSKMNYQLILGRKYMKQICIKMDFETSTVSWYDKNMSFHPRNYFNNNELLRKVLSNEPYSVAEAYANQTTHIYQDAATKYEKTDLNSLVQQQAHLDEPSKKHLLNILQDHSILFAGLNDRQLGIFPNREYHIDLNLGAKAYHIKQPYSVPLHQQEAVKTELLRQLKLGILQRCYSTEWGMPMFIIPKPDGSCRLIADFRELNKATKQLHYPLPTIQAIFHRRRNFVYVTLIDVSMQFHTFKLDAKSQDKCVIVTPFGKFKYVRLPMGFLNSPSWAQAAMDELFSDMPDVEVYIDDVGIFSTDFTSHCKTVRRVLTKLQDHNFTVKPAKCHWFKSQAPWLGHIITPEGILPDPLKINPILKLAFPSTITQLRSFIGMVNFYRSFWRRRAHIMAPLTALSGRSKGKLQSTPTLIKAFDLVKKAIAQNVLLAFPDPNIPYDIYTDASDYQLGAVIMQNKKTVAFFSRKLSTAQLKYPTIDKEMLCIVEVLKEYRSILWGAKINVYTDHINLTRQTITSNRIMTWRMLCEEFSPIFHYIKGPDNTIADALSRLPIEEEKGTLSTTVETVQSSVNNSEETLVVNKQSNGSECNAIEDLFINYPADLPNFPIAFPQLMKAQQEDESIQSTKHYQTKRFYEYDLKVYTLKGRTKIVLPNSLVPATIKWYHHTMGHAGSERLLRSISQFLYSPGLKDKVNAFVKTCDACQRYKNPGPGVGHVPARNESMVPFEQIAIDTVGPWTLNIEGLGKVTINAYSIIDTCSNLLELKRASQNNPSGKESVQVLEDTWLSRYPKPVRIIYDQGTEYCNIDFESFLISQGIKGCPSTVKNPQSNAILERVHDVMKTSLRTQGHSNPPTNIEDANAMVDRILASAQYAVRVCVHKTYGVSPGSIVFQRDMLLPIPIIVNLQLLREKRQAIIDQNNLKENKRRRQHDYTVGDQMMIIAFKPHALQDRAKGPYTITQVHSNGTVSYLLNQETIDRINIRRIKPYYAVNNA